MIQVLGWYDHDNIGDEAYKLAFTKLFPDETFIFSEKINGNPDKIILGGGDVYNAVFLKTLSKFPKAKKYAFSINIRKEDIDVKLTQFDKIIARNSVEVPFLKEIKIQHKPDFTFILEANKERGKQLLKTLFTNYKVDLYDNVVSLNLNSFLCVRESLLARDYINFEKVSMELGRLMDETPASFILMPFGNGFPQNDRIANGVAYANSKYWKKNLLLLDKLDVQSTLDICAAVDAAITTRLHAGIFSCIGETPFIDLTHHTKTQLFMEFIGKSDWSLDYWHFDYAAAKNLLHHFLNNKEQHRKEMSRININAKKLLYPLIDMQL